MGQPDDRLCDDGGYCRSAHRVALASATTIRARRTLAHHRRGVRQPDRPAPRRGGDRLPRLLCRTLSLACVQRRGYCDHPRRHLPALLRLAPGQELDMNNGSHLQDRDEARSGQAWRLLFAAWSIAIAATLGALFIGEVMGQRPRTYEIGRASGRERGW